MESQESLENGKGLGWIKVSEEDKKARVERKKKKKQKDKKEAAATKRMSEKLAKVDATVAAETKKMEKTMEQAKRRALNKEKATGVKGVGGKKGLFCSPCVYELIVEP
jgi:hypothetical protein